jgi:hypothetical protein
MYGSLFVTGKSGAIGADFCGLDGGLCGLERPCVAEPFVDMWRGSALSRVDISDTLPAVMLSTAPGPRTVLTYLT